MESKEKYDNAIAEVRRLREKVRNLETEKQEIIVQFSDFIREFHEANKLQLEKIYKYLKKDSIEQAKGLADFFVEKIKIDEFHPTPEKMAAIRKMLNAPAAQSVKLSSGEIIKAWTLFDENGNEPPESFLTEDVLIHGYSEFLQCDCPDEYK